MPASCDLVNYYALRAREYERIYEKPERQADLEALRMRVPELFSGRSVYEVACGTGYWTQYVASSARAIFATDANEEVLEVARAKALPEGRVVFSKGDAFALPAPPFSCDAGFAAFWWSHLRRDEISGFLQGFFGHLPPGALFAFMDNVHVEGSSLPITRTDPQGNTYQTRRLEDGSWHEVLKNFPSDGELRRWLNPCCRTVTCVRLPYYWLAWGQTR